MKKILGLIGLLCCSYVGSAQTWPDRARDFKTIPASVRPNPLWFWNDSEVKPDELKRQMAGFKEAGYGGLSILPFGKDFKPKYLTEDYFAAYRVCMEEAKKLGLTLWIYDEYGFPSGTAGDVNGDGFGRFRAKYPEHTNKRLDKTEYRPASGSVFELSLPEAGQVMAVVAMDTVNFRRINLNGSGATARISWNVPSGNWKVMLFTCVDAGNTIVDYLSPEAARLYIGMTHEKYAEHFADYFGSTVRGTFFDEPTMYYAEGRTWTPDFNRKFEAQYGFSPELYYPALWEDIGPETTEARNYLFGFRTQLYAEGYVKEVDDWSREHGLLATGHQDNEEVVNPVGTSGDLMKCFQYLTAPGIDKIGGDRPAERFYKITSSSAYNWDHSLVMSETYGAMGNIGWNEIFGIAMDQYAKGINVLIPHAVWYNPERIVFLPELSLRNPIYADSLPAMTDYLGRLNVLMQNEDRWVGEVAVLYPIETMQAGHYLDGPLDAYAGGVKLPETDYVEVGVALSDTLGCDFMFLHPDVLDQKCRVEGGKLNLENQVQYSAFSTIIIPSSQTISLSNLKKISDFAQAGGQVVFTTRLPEKATLAADDTEVTALVASLLELPNVSFEKLPTAANLARSVQPQSLRFTANPVRNIHKLSDGKNLWFFANPDTAAKVSEFELDGKYALECWDPHTGDIGSKAAKIRHKKGKTMVTLNLKGCYSLFLIEK